MDQGKNSYIPALAFTPALLNPEGCSLQSHNGFVERDIGGVHRLGGGGIFVLGLLATSGIVRVDSSRGALTSAVFPALLFVAPFPAFVS